MSFNRNKHVRYWHLSSNLLPDHYISTDSSRMTLGYFTIAALDLLGALETVKPEDRQGWTEWIYSCQCEEGGFRGFTGTDLGKQRNEVNRVWDPANVPATFFALVALLVLGDDMDRVNRDGCLAWLPRLQRTDGSFGEVLSEKGSIEGGTDLRYCCCAAGIAYILQGAGDLSSQSIDEDALVSYIRSCQSYNGGFGESPSREPHSGLTYCAVGALAFVQQLRGRSARSAIELVPSPQNLIRWILQRQTDVLVDDEDEAESGEEGEEEHDQPNQFEGGSKAQSPGTLSQTRYNDLETVIAGFNGRDGKIADTCYCFWNTGALAIIDAHHLVDAGAMKQYLLHKVQHLIGGFGKGIGAPPDVLHSYLGLAALSLTGQADLKSVEPAMCISVEAAARLADLKWKKRVADQS